MPPRSPLSARCPSAPELWRRLVARARSEHGFTLIEVLASALVIVTVAVGALAALDAGTRESSVSRLRSDAQALAEQDQARLHGLSIDELANINRTLPTVTLDGVPFTVREQATFISDSTQSQTCSNPTTDYVQAVSTVTWANMGGSSPVTQTGIITPPIAETANGQGGLAVAVTGTGGAGVQGMTVTISGPASATMTTDANGCVLFGDLTPGTYTIDVYSYGPTYVDQSTGTSVTATNPDVVSEAVVAGAIAGQSVSLAAAGTISATFASTSGNPSGTAAGAPAIVAYNSYMGGNHMRLCTLRNGNSCPVVGGGDTYFPNTDWPQLATPTPTTAITAYPLAPLTTPYTVYGGFCTSDEPALYGGTDQAATVSSGTTTSVSLNEPAMVINVYTVGGNGKNTTYQLPSRLFIRDLGCNVRYTGYTGIAPPVSNGQNPEQALVLENTAYATNQAGGIIKYPAMPYGKYSVCVDNGTNYWEQSYTNNTSPSTVTFNLSNTSTGLVANELGNGSNQC